MCDIRVWVLTNIINDLATSFYRSLLYRFSDMLKERDRGRNRQPMALDSRIVNLSGGEYLCPLCKRLSNAILPLIPALSHSNLKRFEYQSLLQLIIE